MNASAHLLVSSAHRLGPCVDQWFASLAAHQNHLLSFQKKKQKQSITWGPAPEILTLLVWGGVPGISKILLIF